MKDKLQEDIKKAMKERNQTLLTTLRGLMSEIKRIEIDTRKDLTQEGCIEIVQREVKKRRDALGFAEQAARQDLIDQNLQEIAVLQSYLGAQLSDAELRQKIADLKAGGADNVGKIMGALNKDHKGQFEGRKASEMIKEILG